MFGEQTVCSPNNKNGFKAVGNVGNNHGPSANYNLIYKSLKATPRLREPNGSVVLRNALGCQLTY